MTEQGIRKIEMNGAIPLGVCGWEGKGRSRKYKLRGIIAGVSKDHRTISLQEKDGRNRDTGIEISLVVVVMVLVFAF